MRSLGKIIIVIVLGALPFCANAHKEGSMSSKLDTKLYKDALAKMNKKASSSRLDDFYDDLFLSYVLRDPQELTKLLLFEKFGLDEHNKFLNDFSLGALYKELDEKKKALQQLREYSSETLSLEDKISSKTIEWTLSRAQEGEQFLFHDYKIDHMIGTLSYLKTLFIEDHPLQTLQDVQNYLARLSQIAVQLEKTREFLDYQAAKGIVLPAFSLDKVISSLEKMVPDVVEENVFYSRLAKGLEKIECANELKKSYLKNTCEIIKGSVYPAYRLMIDCFKMQRTNNSDNNGVWALPSGDEYYQYMLKGHTTTDMSADEIYELGLCEVADIHEQMRLILAQEGVVDQSREVGDLLQDLLKNPQFYYPETAQGREQCLIDYVAIIERSRKELGHLFDIKPLAPVEIKPVPEDEQESQISAYYKMPSLDGTRPGVFYVNLRSMDEVPSYGMETLALHEAEPGHHFQLALQQEMDLPWLRKVIIWYTAYGEGWALYVEKLAYEQGFYSSAYAKLGHLQDELLRAVRLVVDTGIHKKRWTREYAIDYMQKVTGYHRDTVVTEVERYFVWPGQACAYKIGQLKILELRKRAQDRLGDLFDIREFHNRVLMLGCVPLGLLEEVIDLYIAETLV